MLRSRSRYSRRQAQDEGEDELMVNLRNFSVEVATPRHVQNLIFEHCITSHFLLKVVQTTPLSVVFTSTSEIGEASSDLILPLLQRWNVSGFLTFDALSPPPEAAFEFVQKKMLEDTAALDKAFRKCPGIPNEVFVLSAGFNATPWDRHTNNWELSEPRNNGVVIAIGLSAVFMTCSILLLGVCYHYRRTMRQEDGKEDRSSQKKKSKLVHGIPSIVSTAEFGRSADGEDSSYNEERDRRKVSIKKKKIEPFEHISITQLSIDTEDVRTKEEKTAPFEGISFKPFTTYNEDVTSMECEDITFTPSLTDDEDGTKKEEKALPIDDVTITPLSTENEYLPTKCSEKDANAKTDTMIIPPSQVDGPTYFL